MSIRRVGLVFVLVLTGCPKKGGDAADAAAEAEVAAVVDAAPAPAAAPAAKNAADIARFGTEKPLAEPSKLVDPSTAVRTSPGSGTVVVTLKNGSDVTKIADFKDFFLVMFADPAAPTTTLMGWVPKGAFVADIVDAGIKDAAVVDAAPAAVVDAGATPAGLKCAAGQDIVVLGQPVCKKKCATDKDCKGGAAGTCARGNGPTGKVILFCQNE